ncbi:P-loop containing nucleoside triphosphate hydrolase protein [Mycotypha africana]|uniref:P-loop containing nucleoside triphosphate hydrolase protein n=1 Tax=Mycotypha africana TaxID=64632 RepID=UPI002301721F|nr:P-loop containing nucleoside triphosphate hydrolase protein [Mycotypha africana]KAI8981653.1 P-loop containing nucleoside triphosphate hydrolase protein [Mycotypha africana]
MLINYDMFRSLVATTKYSGDKDEYFEMFINPGPDIVILDEAHRIKNSSSALSSLISRMHTRSRICLTGYPLQNHISEYYDMISFVAPGLLGSSKSFKGFFRNDIERCYADSSLSIKKQAAMKMYILQLLTDVVTHRRDGSVLNLDLPPKTEYVIRFKLSPFQLEGYKNLIELSQAMNPLVGLLTLRAICNHPKIFKNLMKNRQIKQRNLELDKEYGKTAFSDDTYIPSTAISARRNSNSDAEDEDIENLDTADIAEDNEVDAFAAFLTRGHEWAIKYLDRDEVETWKCSGKMSFIVELAKNCHVIKEKLLIVSHSLACLEYIEGLLPVLDIKTLRIDGSTSFGERQEIIDKFQLKEDIDVMLLSAKAAAIGINLTAANRIVLVDQDWNPLYDEQSIGRVFRYGQDKPVFVYRLITASTIEERIFAQSVHKKSISRYLMYVGVSLTISRPW